jgi:4,5-DOPA dioxygenase extradiol
MPTPTVAAMPAVFIGHGSPMNALETNRFTSAWRAFGACVPRPRGILAVSAHWYVNATAVTAMAQPRTIHDFYGFPPALSAVQYPAPGNPELAAEVADLLRPTRVGLDHDSWGLDHGTWSVLVHMFPDASVPVVQLSLHAGKDMEEHLELGSRLDPLRRAGVLVLGSGNVVHNLRALDWSQPDLGFDWTRRFDEAARRLLAEAPGDIARLREHPDYARSVPTPEHFLPLVYIAGLAQAAGRGAEVLVDGHAFGSLSMAAYAVAADCPIDHDERRPSAAVPDPRVTPPEDTNL